MSLRPDGFLNPVLIGVCYIGLRIFWSLSCKPYALETRSLASWLGRDDQCDALHLRPSRHRLVAEVRAVRNLERYGAKLAEAAIHRLFAFPETLLNVGPVARVA